VLTVNLERDQILKVNVQVPELQCYSGTSAVGAPGGDWTKFVSESRTIQSVDAQGNVVCKATVEIKVLGAVAPPPPPARDAQCPGVPTITFAASPERIREGGSSKLSWEVKNADKAVIDDPQIGGVMLGVPAAWWVSPKATTKYTLKATGCGGTETKTATVTVEPPSPACPNPPTIDWFTAARLSINAGESTELSWSVKNATSTEIDGKAATSPFPVKPLTTTKYTLTAKGCGTPVTQTLEVMVQKPAAPVGCPNDFYNLGCGNLDVAAKMSTLLEKYLKPYKTRIDSTDLLKQVAKSCLGLPVCVDPVKGCPVNITLDSGQRQAVNVYCEKSALAFGSGQPNDPGMYNIVDKYLGNVGQITDLTMQTNVRKYLELIRDLTVLCLIKDADHPTDIAHNRGIYAERQNGLNAIEEYYKKNIKSHAEQNPNR
jgi:hypothetical protein